MAQATLLGKLKNRVGQWLVSAQARANYIRWFELRYLRGATLLARAALRLVPYPTLSQWFSLAAIPAGVLCELTGGHNRWGVTLGVVATKENG